MSERPSVEARQNRAWTAAAFVAVGVVLGSAEGRAQEADPASTARRRLGPLAFNPSITTSIGTDSNIFNESIAADSDVVGNVRPSVEAWLRLGRARLSGTSTVDFSYFKEFDTERSVNSAHSVRIELASPRVRPFASATVVNSRARLNFDIDARARYAQHAYAAGLDVALGGRSTLGIAGNRQRFAFGEGVTVPPGVRELLNRDTDAVSLSLRQRLTPLTTFVGVVSREQDRFKFAPVRDSRSVRVTAGVEFNPFALIDGSASVGYRRFATNNPAVPDFTGVVTSANLGYTLLGTTRFVLGLTRDVAYSVDELQPYFVLTGVNGAITRRFSEAWELLATAGRQRLAYQGPAGLATPSVFAPDFAEAVGRDEAVLTYSAGVGYRLSPFSRIGLNAEYVRRDSPVTGREFDGLRINSTVTYGF